MAFGFESLDQLANDETLKKPNWNGGGEQPLSNEAVVIARAVLSKLSEDVRNKSQSVITSIGTIEIEWYVDGNHFSVHIREKSDIASIVAKVENGISAIGLNL